MPDQNFPPVEDKNFNPPWQEDREEELPAAPVQETPKAEASQTVFSPAADLNQLPASPAEEKTDFNSPPEPTVVPSSPEAEKKAEAFLSQDESFSLQAKAGGGFKKLLLFLLILGLIVGLVFLVLKVVLPRFQKPKEVTLTYWGLWEPENLMRGLITEWESKNPNIKINY